MSELLAAIVAGVPADFADPGADWRAVRAMMAPFHGQPCSPELAVEIRDCGGVATGFHTLDGVDGGGRIAFQDHGADSLSCPLSE